MQWLQLVIRLRIDSDSIDIRLPLDCNSTALLPFDDLCYDCKPIGYGLLRTEA